MSMCKNILSEFGLVTCFGSLEVEQVCMKISTDWFMSCNRMGQRKTKGRKCTIVKHCITAFTDKEWKRQLFL